VVDASLGQVRGRIDIRAALRPAVALTLIAGLSAAIRLPFVLERATPRYFPDEYLYGELARSLAGTGQLRVLGSSSSLPSLLAPIVQALAWLPGDAATAFRLTQLLHVVAMSLAVVPVYLIARRLEVGTTAALAAAAFAVVCPDLLYAGYVTADAIGYLLALVAVHAALRALTARTVASQAWCIAACGLATATRLQYAVLLPATALASLVVERRDWWRAPRRLSAIWAVVLAGAVVALAAGSTVLGRYGTLASAGASRESLTWLPVSGYLLAVAAGAAIVPGALAWTCNAFWRPRTREHAAFAALLALVMGGIAAAAVVMSVETGSDRFFERYLMIGVPLLGIAFAAWLREGRPAYRLALATAVLLLLGATQVPVAAYAEGQGRADSPLLLAVSWLERWLGVGTASLAVAVLVTGAAAVGVLRRGRGIPALAVSFALMVALSAGAHAADISLSARVADRLATSPRGWVDASGVRDVLLVQTWQSEPARAMTQAFWNRSVTRGAVLGPRAETMDGALDHLFIRGNGELHLRGAQVRGPLLVARDGTRAVFAAATTVAHQASFELVEPHGAARLAALLEGVGDDGWLGQHGRLTVYPGSSACRSLSVLLSLPAGTRPVDLTVSAGGRTRALRVTDTRPVALGIAAQARPATLLLTAESVRSTGSSRPRTVRTKFALKSC
jgi:hypothetical protein